MKIKVKYIEKNKNDNTIQNKNYIGLYLFGIIRVKKIKFERKIHTEKKSNNQVTNTIFMIIKQIIKSLEKEEIVKIVSRIFKSIKVHDLDMDLGINFNNPILNAYSIAAVNSILPLYFAKNSSNINLKNIRYTTFISQKVIDLKIDTTIYISIFKNIPSILKIIFIVLKSKLSEMKNNKNTKAYGNELNKNYT